MPKAAYPLSSCLTGLHHNFLAQHPYLQSGTSELLIVTVETQATKLAPIRIILQQIAISRPTYALVLNRVVGWSNDHT